MTFLFLFLLTLLPAPHALAVDLTNATVVAANPGKPVQVLVEEVEKRAMLRWPVAAAAAAGPSIVIEQPAGQGPREGYRIETRGNSVIVAGNDDRGVLFGVGRLLRELRIERGRVHLPDGFRLETAPRYPLRGHQLGYRAMTNSYDGWTVPMWDQYIRDLAVFGANAIEIMPPRSGDPAPESPHFPLPILKMLPELSRIGAEYGLGVWIWYPAMDADYSKPETVEFALREWEQVFRSLPKLDAVFVPGGDPGHTHPKHLMPLLEKVTGVLRRHHPKAEMWVSPQEFTPEWMEVFYGILAGEPAWLTGVVHGPSMAVSMAELRRRVPKRYRLRNYPDITHSRWCQHAVPEWDPVHALTHGREPINPRPRDMAMIFRRDRALFDGFLTYSEGCNDDVNKAVWSALGWDPDADLFEALRQYGRYFVHPRFADAFAWGLLALEDNWRGPLAVNEGVNTTLAQFRDMERRATPQMLGSFRFQMALYRAYYDAYNRRRLIEETAACEDAMDCLRRAPETGSRIAAACAARALERAGQRTAGRDLRARIFELAEALFQSIRLQTSVARYQANHQDRGATLDTLDVPLSDAPWLWKRLDEIGRMEDEKARLAAMDKVVNWTNPGSGGFYDNLGDPANMPRVVRKPQGWDSSGRFLSPPLSVAQQPYAIDGWRWSWMTSIQVGGVLQMRYSNLDPEARYKVRAVYTAEPVRPRSVRLMANQKFEIHPVIRHREVVGPVEFEIPAEATRGGELLLEWSPGPDEDSCRVSEVWLLRVEPGGDR